jgi:tetratricopeptide (TPR) repeat protein
MLISVVPLVAQDILDITVKGISDASEDGAQKDRNEAILDAKRQACEKAGLKLQSTTRSENFQVVFDYVEAEAEAVLLPGFQVIDIGYVQDGTYQVVLNGKVKVVKEQEQISAKELRLAKSLYDRNEHAQARQILEKYIDNDDEKVDEALKEESLYLFIKWGYSFNLKNDCEKFAAFYPNSTKLGTVLQFGNFAQNALLEYNKDVSIENEDWLPGEYVFDDDAYQMMKNILQEKQSFKDYHGRLVELDIEFSILQKEDMDDQEPAAYLFKVSSAIDNEKLIIIDRFSKLRKTTNNTFQHSSSGKWFDNFSLKFFQVKGDVPLSQETCNYTIKFEIFQKGF